MIPALLYHKVTPQWEVGVTCVSPRRFALQMQLARDQGWTTVLPDVSIPTTEKAFILVFDDGYECIHRYALPVLDKLGFRALVFVPVGYLGKWNDWDHHLLGRRFRHLNRGMLDELLSAGWMLGSHTLTHPGLPDVDDAVLRRELADSRARLGEIAGREVDWVSFPFGRYDRRVLEAAQEAGYRVAVVPRLNSARIPDFKLWQADAVYTWDTASSVLCILRRGKGYRAGRITRNFANRLAGGTIIWRKMFG